MVCVMGVYKRQGSGAIVRGTKNFEKYMYIPHVICYAHENNTYVRNSTPRHLRKLLIRFGSSKIIAN